MSPEFDEGLVIEELELKTVFLLPYCYATSKYAGTRLISASEEVEQSKLALFLLPLLFGDKKRN